MAQSLSPPALPARLHASGLYETVVEHTIKTLVTQVPHPYSHRTRVPRAQARKSHQTFWTYQPCVLAALTPIQVVCIDPKRWPAELMTWELKAGLGLGAHQVRGDKDRCQQSVDISVLAYLLVLRVCQHQMVSGKR